MQLKMPTNYFLLLLPQLIEIFLKQILTTYLWSRLLPSRMEEHKIFWDEDVDLLDAACKEQVRKLDDEVS